MTWTKEEAKEHYHRCRAEMIEYLGGHCVVCGTTEELQFDHRDPKTKSFAISPVLILSNPRVREELDKCQLLCRPHHEEKTAQERSGWTHGTVYGWMTKKCRCEVCEPLWRAWNDNRNAARRVRTGRGPYDKSPVVCGTRRAYRKGCRCDSCRAANAAHTREQRAKK